MKLHTERHASRCWRVGKEVGSKKSEADGKKAHQVGAAIGGEEAWTDRLLHHSLPDWTLVISISPEESSKGRVTGVPVLPGSCGQCQPYSLRL